VPADDRLPTWFIALDLIVAYVPIAVRETGLTGELKR
jgi:hypothetical protein